MKTTRTIRWLVALLLITLAGTLPAQTLPAVDRGWYDQLGLHDPANNGYALGNCASCTALYRRHFFVFDLTGISDTITAASVNVWMDQPYDSLHASETYALYEVSTPVSDLTGGIGGVSAYNDLGSGTAFGSYVLTAADGMTQVTVPLNAAGLAMLNAGRGGQVAVGGALTTLDADPLTHERVFNNTSGTSGSVQLELTTSAVTRPPVDLGWYTDVGTHIPTNVNYLLGNCAGCNWDYYRSWFVFDVDAPGGLVTGAKLALQRRTYWSVDPTELITLHDVTTPLADLMNGVAGPAAYDDLGDGMSYGTYDVLYPGTPNLVEIPLNGQGLVALQDAPGGMFALGGAMTTLDADPTTNEYVFSGSGVSPDVVELVLDVEPAWTWLGGGTKGIAGTPLLLASGPLVGGTTAIMSLSDAPANALMVAWISFNPTPNAALGGMVHAFPFANQLIVFANSSGDFTASTTWPTGIAPNTQAWFQFLVQDPGSFHGIIMSNGLLATTP